MELRISGSSKEIAALVLELQGRQQETRDTDITMPRNDDLLVSQGFENGFKCE